MARGAVRRVTEGLIFLTVMITVSLIVGFDDRRLLFAGPLAATFVSLILQHGGEALRNRRRMIILIGLLACLAAWSAVMLLDKMEFFWAGPVAGVVVWLLLFLLWPEQKTED